MAVRIWVVWTWEAHIFAFARWRFVVDGERGMGRWLCMGGSYGWVRGTREKNNFMICGSLHELL